MKVKVKKFVQIVDEKSAIHKASIGMEIGMSELIPAGFFARSKSENSNQFRNIW